MPRLQRLQFLEQEIEVAIRHEHFALHVIGVVGALQDIAQLFDSFHIVGAHGDRIILQLLF
ncbi:MAG: hypothetical protein O7G85_12835 [Planctomycetota bacterium]|nr:hypothetical protein [Planctomycetota bacterium]